MVQVGKRSPDLSPEEHLATTQVLVREVTQSDDTQPPTTTTQRAYDLRDGSQTVTIRRVLMPRPGSARFEQHPDTYFKTIPRLFDPQSRNNIPDIDKITHTVRSLIGVDDLAILQIEDTEDKRFVWFRKP